MKSACTTQSITDINMSFFTSKADTGRPFKSYMILIANVKKRARNETYNQFNVEFLKSE